MSESGQPVRTAEPPGPGEAWTVLRMILWSAGYLKEKGVEEGRLDAEHLLADALDTTRLQLYLEFDRPLMEEELDAFRTRLRRRARREPLQHILGRTGFRELELRTDARALIPRPETEELVEAVLEWARSSGEEALTALDLGTGTGAIALSLALEGPFRKVVAVDASADALELARENLEAGGPGAEVELREGSLFEPVGEGEVFDVIVSNPPYVSEPEASSLEPEVADWEPAAALVAGPTGMEVILRIGEGAGRHLRTGGLLALEVGLGQAGPTTEALGETGVWTDVQIRRDLQGRERIVTALRGGA